MVPLPRVKLFTVITDGRCHDHLHDLEIITDCLWREIRLRHFRNQALDDKVIDAGQRRIAQSWIDPPEMTLPRSNSGRLTKS